MVTPEIRIGGLVRSYRHGNPRGDTVTQAKEKRTSADAKSNFVPPPHLSMKEYCQFIADNLKHVDPIKCKRQKAIEEVIDVPFRKV
jgi:hypothetical protein